MKFKILTDKEPKYTRRCFIDKPNKIGTLNLYNKGIKRGHRIVRKDKFKFRQADEKFYEEIYFHIWHEDDTYLPLFYELQQEIIENGFHCEISYERASEYIPKDRWRFTIITNQFRQDIESIVDIINDLFDVDKDLTAKMETI